MSQNDNDRNILHIASDLPCHICQEWLHAFVEGEEVPLGRRAIAMHIETCRACSAEREALEDERRLFLEAAVESPALSPRFAANVIAELRREQSERRLRSARRLWRSSALSIAAAAVAVAALSLWWRPANEKLRDDRPAVVAGTHDDAPGAWSLTSAGETLAVSVPRAPRLSPTPVSTSVPRIDARIDAACGAGDDGHELPRSPSVPAAPDLKDSIEFSARVLHRREPVPCTRDVNRDGETDISDAAHLFMLAVADGPFGAEVRRDEDADFDCSDSCRT